MASAKGNFALLLDLAKETSHEKRRELLRQVTDVFLERFPGTIELALCAMVFAIGVGIPLGYFAARRHGSVLDSASVVGSLIGVAIPVFFLAFLLKYWFAIETQTFPVSGRQDAALGCTRVTNFFVLDGLLTREFDCTTNALRHLVLPAIALATIPFAVIFRITRASVLDVLDEDYVRTAEAKGLTAQVIRARHVMRNALLPVITTLGMVFSFSLGANVLVEKVFAWPGIGSYALEALVVSDYAAVQGFVLSMAVLFVLLNLTVDIVYTLIDPRVKIDG